MYIHVGNNRLVRSRDIIGIFDMDTATVSQVTRKYLTRAQREGRIDNVKNELPKSFILSKDEKNGYKIYVLQLSPKAVAGRTGNIIKSTPPHA